MSTSTDRLRQIFDTLRAHADASGHDILALSVLLMQDYVEGIDEKDAISFTGDLRTWN